MTVREPPPLTRAERHAANREKVDPSEAGARAYDMSNDPNWQEDTMNLMALSPEGHRYIHHGEGSDTAAVVDSQMVPGSDAGAW